MRFGIGGAPPFHGRVLRGKLKLVSFDIYRTLGMDNVRGIKPGEMLRHASLLQESDWVLFPEEWQLGVLVDALRCRVFPSVQSYRYGQDKVQFTRVAQALFPAHVPETIIARAEAEAALDAADRLGFPLVLKHPRSSMGQGVFKIENRRELMEMLPNLDVLYAQEYLEIERDLRVVWIGDRVVAAYWRIGGDGFHHNIAKGAQASFTDIPPAALEFVSRVAKALQIDHAGFDLAEVSGHWYLIEANVRFGNAGLKEAGIDLSACMTDWLERNTPPDIDDPETDPDRPQKLRTPEIALSADEPTLPIAC